MSDNEKQSKTRSRVKISRRDMLRYTALTGTMFALGNYADKYTFAQTRPTLNLYLAIWPNSTGVLLPWKSSPRDLAEKFIYMLWKYRSSKGAIIGHTALLAEMHDSGSINRILFSNTGGSPGFYEHSMWIGRSMPGYRFPEEYKDTWIRVAFHIDEVLAGHVTDGRWESLAEFQSRVAENEHFRVSKNSYYGVDARDKFARLRDIKCQTRNQGNRFGGPKHFGLNTTTVRRINENGLMSGQSMSKYRVGNSDHEIHGGCANAVASVLRAIGLGTLVPNRAEFKMNVDLGRFHNVYLPVRWTSSWFDDNNRAAHKQLTDALNGMPNNWGSGNTIKFVDPNYWYLELPRGSGLKDFYIDLIENDERKNYVCDD